MQYLEKINSLVEKLNNYTKLYDEGNPTISDKEWDSLYFELQRLEKESGIYLPCSPTQKVNYIYNDELRKVAHTHAMLSLDKTKDIGEIKSFCKGRPIICMGKMDGLTCTLRYENGYLVGAETRGDGIEGEDVLSNILTIKNVPKRIGRTELTEVDSEVICTFKNFENFKEDYKNPRNFAAGSLRLLDPRETEKRNLTLVAWDWINNPCESLGLALVELGKLGFTTVPFWDNIEVDCDSLEEIMSQVKSFCEDESFPIDGLVFKYDKIEDYKNAGVTSHHPKGGLAFKFYDEEVTSALQDIEWSMGRTGVLTPVAIFNDIEIEGTQVNRASLSNVSVMLQTFDGKTPTIGSEVYVTKRNQIIPKIEKGIINPTGEIIEIPRICPICGKATELKESEGSVLTLVCGNPQCEGKLVNKIKHYCDMQKGVQIKGLSEATIEKLINWGWLTSIIDLYSLNRYRLEWIKKPGFGQRSVDNILTAIENSRSCELWRFISAIGIPLIGVSVSKQLAAFFGTWANFFNSSQQNYIYSVLPNFGIEMENSINNFDFTEANDIAEYYINFLEKEEEPDDGGPLLLGLTFCITGKLNHYKNRAELQEYIESAGGKVTSSVSKNTSYLINNDLESASSKNMTAQKLSIPIISEEKFINLFGLKH